MSDKETEAMKNTHLWKTAVEEATEFSGQQCPWAKAVSGV